MSVSDGAGSRGRLFAALRAQVAGCADARERAVLLEEIVGAVYETTEMAFAERGVLDSEECAGLARVSDVASGYRLDQDMATVPADGGGAGRGSTPTLPAGPRPATTPD